MQISLRPCLNILEGTWESGDKTLSPPLSRFHFFAHLFASRCSPVSEFLEKASSSLASRGPKLFSLAEWNTKMCKSSFLNHKINISIYNQTKNAEFYFNGYPDTVEMIYENK